MISKFIPQPVRLDDCYVDHMVPGAFFWHKNVLYLGYTDHDAGTVLMDPAITRGVSWDKDPIPLRGVVETCRGYFHFTEILGEEYAVLEVVYYNLSKKMERLREKSPRQWQPTSEDLPDMVRTVQRFVLPPNFGLLFISCERSYMSFQVTWCDPRSLMKIIKTDGSDFNEKRYGKAAIEERTKGDSGCVMGVRGILPSVI